MQKLLLGQDTLDIPADPFTWVTFQAAAPPAGLLEVTTSPPPTATQRVLLGQDTPDSRQGEPDSACSQLEPST